MITGLYFILAYGSLSILLAFIESLRIDAVKGEVENINHSWSVAGGIAAFIVLVIIFRQWNMYVICLGISCLGVRGVFYDPALNLFLNRYIDQVSIKTTSGTDRLEQKNKLSFWVQRLLYLILAAAGFGLFVVAHLIFK